VVNILRVNYFILHLYISFVCHVLCGGKLLQFVCGSMTYCYENICVTWITHVSSSANVVIS